MCKERGKRAVETWLGEGEIRQGVAKGWGGRGREVEDGVERGVHCMGREWFLHFTLVPPT